MISLRRYAIYACIVIFVLFTITHYRERIASRINYSSLSPTYTAKQHPDGRFHWEDVPVHYPVKSLISLPTTKPTKLPKVQFDFPPETAEQTAARKQRRDAVKKTFEKAWRSYKDHAWMHDEVEPLSGGFKDGFGGWGGMSSCISCRVYVRC